MADKRERVRANMVVYLVCVALSLAIWTIQTLSLPQEVKLRVSFLDASEKPVVLAKGQSMLSATGFELLPFWFRSFWQPLEVSSSSGQVIQSNITPDQALQDLKVALPAHIEVRQLTLDSITTPP